MFNTIDFFVIIIKIANYIQIFGRKRKTESQRVQVVVSSTYSCLSSSTKKNKF